VNLPAQGTHLRHHGLLKSAQIMPGLDLDQNQARCLVEIFTVPNELPAPVATFVLNLDREVAFPGKRQDGRRRGSQAAPGVLGLGCGRRPGHFGNAFFRRAPPVMLKTSPNMNRGKVGMILLTRFKSIKVLPPPILL